jgi:hypothetical protein
MPSPQVHIRTDPPSRRIAHARWDGESSTFTCAIERADEAAPAPSLRNRIDTLLHVEEPERRATLGGVDMLLDEANRPISIELYGNPARWKPVAAESLGVPELADVSLDLSYDVNGIASVDVPVSIEHDAASETLTLRFGEDAARWFTFAEGMSIGVSEKLRLAAIRFQSFKLKD